MNKNTQYLSDSIMYFTVNQINFKNLDVIPR